MRMLTKTNEMLSPRTAIRRRVAALLRASLPLWDARLTSARIHESRAIPLPSKKLPTILIYTRDERLEDDAGHSDPGLRRRTLDLFVEAVATGHDADTDADYFCAAIESIVDNNENLGGLVEGTRLSRVSVDADGDSDGVIIGARLEFEVTYWTRPVYLPALECSSENAAPPVYTPTTDEPTEETLILGLTPGLGLHPDHILITPSQILASTVPHIGPPYKDSYEPTSLP